MRGLGRGAGLVTGGGQTRTWTPAVTQSGAPTYTSRGGWWIRIPGTRWITASAVIIISGTSGAVANNPIAITEPVNHSANYVGGIGGSYAIGTATLYDSSSGLVFPAHVVTGAAGSVYLLPSSSTAGALLGYTTSPFGAALAASDAIALTMTYEAAA